MHTVFSQLPCHLPHLSMQTVFSQLQLTLGSEFGVAVTCLQLQVQFGVGLKRRCWTDRQTAGGEASDWSGLEECWTDRQTAGGEASDWSGMEEMVGGRIEGREEPKELCTYSNITV